MGEAIEGRVRELIEDTNFCHVGTLTKDGWPMVVPTWVDLEGDLVVINSAEGRVWPANLRRDPRVALEIINSKDPYEYVWIKGRVVEATHKDADEHIERLAAKYLGEPFPKVAGEVRIKFKIEPLSIHYSPP
jgi:PPOX class probable F420-dependent enzyme